MCRLRRITVAMGLLFCAAAWIPTASAAGVSVDDATAEQKKAAQTYFIDAKKEFDAKNFEKALQGFQASFDVVASPNSILLVARTLRELNRVVEAYRSYEHAVEVAKKAAEKSNKYKKAAEAAQKELDDLRPQIGFLVCQVVGATDDTQLFINDEPVERERWGQEIAVRVGDITVSVKAKGKQDHSEAIAVAGGSTIHKLDLRKIWAPPPPPPKSVADSPAQEKASVDLLGLDKRTWAYIAGGVGAAGVVTFGVFGSMARSKYKSLDDDCPNGVCPTDRNDDIDAGKRNQTIANVGLVVGVVGLGTGTVLYLLSGDKKGRETQVGVGPGSVMIRGTF